MRAEIPISAISAAAYTIPTGLLSADRTRPGLGLTLRTADAARYGVKAQE